MNIEDIRVQFKDIYKANKFVKDKTGVNVIELTGVSFEADEPSIFGEINKDYIERELTWYDSHSRYVKDIPGETPKIWLEIASRFGTINSNYGYLIHSHKYNYQYKCVLKTLQDNPESRRAIMIYTRPSMQVEYNIDGMNDFVCTNTVQYFIRNNKLDVIVNMRSNDAVFGYKNDYAWQLEVQKRLLKDLNVNNIAYELGKITWQVGSLHLYERHFKYLK